MLLLSLFIISHSDLLLCSECKIHVITIEESLGVGKNTPHLSISSRQRGFLVFLVSK